MKNFKNCIQCLDSSVNVYDTHVTSVWVCMLEIAMYGKFSISNATGSLQNHCSGASQMNLFADEPSSSGAGDKRPICNPKRIRVSADANDHDNHTIDKEVVDVNHSTAAIGTAGTAVVSQVKVLYIL